MDETGPDGLVHHTVPSHWILRVFLAGCGIFILFVAPHELWRGVWPPNILSPFFGIILGGGLTVGLGILGAGLFGPELHWTIGPGRIEILARNPFWQHIYRFDRASVAGFVVRENADGDGPTTWSVDMTANTGKRFGTRSFGSREKAESVRKDFEAAFYG